MFAVQFHQIKLNFKYSVWAEAEPPLNRKVQRDMTDLQDELLICRNGREEKVFYSTGEDIYILFDTHSVSIC